VTRRAGAYVLIAGPDGTGKSTLTRHPIEFGKYDLASVRTMHWRPGLLPNLGRIVGGATPDPARPHDRPPYSLAVSIVRLVYYWVDQVAGYWLRIRPCVRRGGLVVMERGYWDILVDPRRYRLGCPSWIMRTLATFVPRPHLTVLLGGDPAVVAARKQELSPAEIARQLHCWRLVAPEPVQLIDGALGEEEVYGEVVWRLGALATTLEGAHA